MQPLEDSAETGMVSLPRNPRSQEAEKVNGCEIEASMEYGARPCVETKKRRQQSWRGSEAKQ